MIPTPYHSASINKYLPHNRVGNSKKESKIHRSVNVKDFCYVDDISLNTKNIEEAQIMKSK